MNPISRLPVFNQLSKLLVAALMYMCVSEVCCAIKLQSCVSWPQRSTDSQLLCKLLCAKQQVGTHTIRTCTLNLDTQSYPPGRKWLSLSWIPLTLWTAHKSRHTKGLQSEQLHNHSCNQIFFHCHTGSYLFTHTRTHTRQRGADYWHTCTESKEGSCTLPLLWAFSTVM